MTNINEILSEIRNSGIRLWVENNSLKYQAPEGKLTPKLRKKIIENKPKIIDFLSKAQLAVSQVNQPIKKLSREDISYFPVSFDQERLWFLHQLDRQSTAHNFTMSFVVRGDIDSIALEKSFNKIIERHESLRTIFKSVEGQPVQFVLPKIDVTLPIVSLEKLSESEQLSKVKQLIKEAEKDYFDLAIAPLIRMKLLNLSCEFHILLIQTHHIVCDEWSVEILLHELSIIYQSIINQSIPILPELSIQYVDYAVWQKNYLTQEVKKNQVDFWDKNLSDSSLKLELPTDRVSSSRVAASKTVILNIPDHLVASLEQVSKQLKVTVFTMLLSSFAILLSRYSDQEDVIIGSPIANRNRTELESLIGFFAYPLILRFDLSGNPTCADFINKVNQVVLDAYNHKALPLSEIVAAVQTERNLSYNPVFQVLFNFIEQKLHPARQLDIDLLSEVYPGQRQEEGITEFYLTLTLQKIENIMQGFLSYNTDLFNEETINLLVGFYLNILERIIKDKERPIAEFVLPQKLEEKIRLAKLAQATQLIIISSTFTAEPIEESINYWMEKLNLSSKVTFTAYNQVFQELLNPNSETSKNEEGINIILIRLEDWVRFEEKKQDQQIWLEKIQQTSQELITAIQQASQTNQAPLIVGICPPSPSVLSNAKQANFLLRIENSLETQLKHQSNLYLITSQDIQATYPVEDYYDQNRDELGHIPYTETFYTALGTAIARKIYTIKQAPYKVIVLDCDNTLWSGVSGEEGAKGVTIDNNRQGLQSFLVEQQKAGKLLCLCSKNNEEDVWSVFDYHEEMPLKKGHIVASKINWQPKSANLKALATELNLGLDSFIFIDDNPVECAEVTANCPEVLALQLPENGEDIPQWLKHLWPLDVNKMTEEDQKRTQMYQQQIAREKLKEQTLTFRDFLASLDLQLEISSIKTEDLPRISQLTQRTNQFNLTTIRRSEKEIAQLLKQEKLEGVGVRVKDRFGDYGLVGVLLFEGDQEVLKVDTFLLSCRVLGRGVEYEMLKFLGKTAQEKQLNQVNLAYEKTSKNQPVLDFLEAVGQEEKQKTETGWIFELAVERVINLKFEPEEKVNLEQEKELASNSSTAKIQARSELMNQIAKGLQNPSKVLELIVHKKKQESSKESREFVAPRNEIEEQLALIFQEVLKREKVGIYDNFFELGGNSILATQVISRIREVFTMELCLNVLFEKPEIIDLAEQISQTRSTIQKLRNLSPESQESSDDMEEFEL
ncbi:HAD-IIIC family phosphatase [Crocosphaera sp.]|uniref:HAD-IIIC family phosphatase n=1 Tax=Crocosphaera sp. TaxID=2729996 RepID=UPI00260C2FB8|nr:HAD-IIIC family phosphatase [Crocosphaera sp.]MDJ0580939.1 HAD-IIIC family phosphatase [Crocosphaera sp.]